MRIPPTATPVPAGVTTPQTTETTRASGAPTGASANTGPASDAADLEVPPHLATDHSGQAIDTSMGKLRMEQAKENQSATGPQYLAYTGPQGADRTSAAHLTQLRGFERIHEMTKNFEHGLDPRIRALAMTSASQLGMTSDVVAKGVGYLSTLRPEDLPAMAGSPGMKGYEERLDLISGLRNDLKDAVAHGDQKAFNRIMEQHGGLSGMVLTGAEVSRREMSLRQINEVEYKQMDPYDFRGSLGHVGTMIHEKDSKETGALVLGGSLTNASLGGTPHDTAEGFARDGSGGSPPMVAGMVVGGSGSFRKPNQAAGVPSHVEEVNPGASGQNLGNPGPKTPHAPTGGGGGGGTVIEGAESTAALDSTAVAGELTGEAAEAQKMFQLMKNSSAMKAEIQAAGTFAEQSFTKGTVSATGAELGALEVEGAAASRLSGASKIVGRLGIGVVIVQLGASMAMERLSRSDSTNPFR